MKTFVNSFRNEGAEKLKKQAILVQELSWIEYVQVVELIVSTTVLF